MLQQRLRNEDGSIAVALLAVIMISGLMASLFAVTVAGQKATRFDRQYTEAIHVAEGGVQELLYLMDENKPPFNGTAVSSGTKTLPGTPAGHAAKTYQYTVTPNVAAGTWVLSVTGQLAGVQRTIEVTAKRGPRFPAPLYTEVKMHLTGSGCVKSYDSRNNNVYNPCPSTTGNGIAQSGGTMSIGGMSLDGTKANASLNLGSDENVRFITDRLAACGALSDWTASANSGVLAITPSPRCYRDMTFDRNTEVRLSNWSQFVELYVSGTIRFTRAVTVRITCTCGALPVSNKPPAAALRIFSVGPQVLFNKSNNITAALYAPRAECRGDQAMPGSTLYGSLVCSTLKTNGQFYVHFDDAIKDLIGAPYVLQRWTET